MDRAFTHVLIVGLLAATATLGGCFVEGRCLGDGDCASDERCLSGACVGCRSAADCAALVDKNPNSPTYGAPIELIAFRDDVVLIYLANAT